MPQDISRIYKTDNAYPPLLHEALDAPLRLYVKGLPLNPEEQYFAVVGTRHPSMYGAQMAEKFSFELARAGFTIVSGLAYGIDTEAHKAALQAKGKTIAVLGSGLNYLTPRSNADLAKRIIKSGSIITEFEHTIPPTKHTFPQRNRIIAGMSIATLVVEAPERSGALITARLATEYHREVFALPGNITQESSRGTNFLIRDGSAHPVSSVEDIFKHMEILDRQHLSLQTNRNGNHLSDTEESIYTLLKKGPRTIDEIGIEVKLPIPHVATLLSLLEIKGLVTLIGSYVFVTR